MGRDARAAGPCTAGAIESSVMDTQADAEPAPTAAVRRARRIPLIWTVPLITALIGGWLAWDTFSKRGPSIVVEFDNGSGLTPGQSQLKYKDVPMGTVK